MFPEILSEFLRIFKKYDLPAFNTKPNAKFSKDVAYFIFSFLRSLNKIFRKRLMSFAERMSRTFEKSSAGDKRKKLMIGECSRCFDAFAGGYTKLAMDINASDKVARDNAEFDSKDLIQHHLKTIMNITRLSDAKMGEPVGELANLDLSPVKGSNGKQASPQKVPPQAPEGSPSKKSPQKIGKADDGVKSDEATKDNRSVEDEVEGEDDDHFEALEAELIQIPQDMFIPNRETFIAFADEETYIAVQGGVGASVVQGTEVLHTSTQQCKTNIVKIS